MNIYEFVADLQSWMAQPPLFPDPPPAAPPGKIAEVSNTFIAWMKWGGLVGAFASLIAAGIMMNIGRRNRNNMAIEGLVGVPWVIGGLGLISGSASLIAFLA